MTEEEKKGIEFIKDLIAWDVRHDLCPNKEECENLEIILNLIEKLKKENEELKNQEVQRYSTSIPVQKVKDKIRKNEEIIDISNDGDLIHELLQKNKVYEELLESEE